ncbi:hypothetical protein [Alteribacillus sp. YIM 98480]|uniref:hypothetical protein n=1 Tax=Alteribacillus sp. YIM 98480 TaxID=2606599 RepID=UPI00131C6E63|nr:hypothetical protein [Alteribacillus sp. YIM 98480]
MSEILNLCDDILSKYDMKNIDISMTDKDNYAMYYNIDTSEIFINVEILKQESMSFLIPFLDYAQIIFLHELGHALDNDLQKIHKDNKECFDELRINPFADNTDDLLLRIKNNNIKAEINAWNIAESIIDKRLKRVCRQIKNKSLKTDEEIQLLQMEKIKLKIEIAQNKVQEMNE